MEIGVRLFGAFLALTALGVALFLLFAPPMGDPLAGSDLVLGKGGTEVVEFYAYECPYCARHALEVFPLLKEVFVETGKVRYHFRPVPYGGTGPTLPGEAGRCAWREGEGKFLEYHHALFEEREAWEGLKGEDLLDWLLSLGRRKGLGEAFARCLKGREEERAVKANLALAQGLRIKGTPTFFIGKEAVTGFRPFSWWEERLGER